VPGSVRGEKGDSHQPLECGEGEKNEKHIITKRKGGTTILGVGGSTPRQNIGMGMTPKKQGAHTSKGIKKKKG